MTPIKTRSERKKGASVRIHTTRLLSVRSCALEVAHRRKRQQLSNKNQEFPSEIWTHRFVCCAVPLTGVVPFPWAGSFHFSRLPTLRWQVIYIRQIQRIPMEESHPMWYLGPSVLNGEKNSPLACAPLNSSHAVTISLPQNHGRHSSFSPSWPPVDACKNSPPIL